jgi:hypothetical protein
MNVVILQAFRDKNTQRVYQPGEAVSLTKRRYAEIVKTLGDGFIAEAAPKQTDPEPAE